MNVIAMKSLSSCKAIFITIEVLQTRQMIIPQSVKQATRVVWSFVIHELTFLSWLNNF